MAQELEIVDARVMTEQCLFMTGAMFGEKRAARKMRDYRRIAKPL
jgi:hypothetical protein